MITPAIEAEIKSFLHELSAACKECFRKGAACSSCPAQRAGGILTMMAPPIGTPYSDVQAGSEYRRERIIEILTAAGRPLKANDIDLGDCSTSLRSMTLSAMAATGKIIRRGHGKGSMYAVKKAVAR
jgi:hypothetical protein